MHHCEFPVLAGNSRTSSGPAVSDGISRINPCGSQRLKASLVDIHKKKKRLLADQQEKVIGRGERLGLES